MEHDADGMGYVRRLQGGAPVSDLTAPLDLTYEDALRVGEWGRTARHTVPSDELTAHDELAARVRDTLLAVARKNGDANRGIVLPSGVLPADCEGELRDFSRGLRTNFAFLADQLDRIIDRYSGVRPMRTGKAP